MVGPNWVPPVPRRRGRKPRVPVNQLLQALTCHVMQGAGTLAEHFDELFEEPLANSSWSDRRIRLPWDIFADLMRRALRPVATRRHCEAFWRGWRLTALDGTQYSVTNTLQITATTTKATSRRGRAAFAKIGVGVLLELAQLYAARWEHELYFRDAKRVVRQTDVLQSHTIVTAAQEIAAIVVATALLARERARAATGQIPALRVKFGVVLAVVRSLWFFLGPCEDLLTDQQKDQIVQRGTALMRRGVTGKRRSRTNPRAVRQPVRKWPRLMETHSVEGPLQFTIPDP